VVFDSKDISPDIGVARQIIESQAEPSDMFWVVAIPPFTWSYAFWRIKSIQLSSYPLVVEVA
jgi:hypothetical protein